ncbi:MAG: dihydrodipicolinate synthase family protein, partial [Planctomycetota bacterium]
MPDVVSADAVPPIIRNREITGMSAILLPMQSASEPDWDGFQNHVQRTVAAGLTPAVNMDTGYANLIDDQQRQRALELAKTTCDGEDFVGGVFVGDQAGDRFDFDGYRRGIDQVVQLGGTPIIFQSYGLTGQADDDIAASYAKIGNHTDTFLAFELGKMFAPFGSIYSLSLYESLLGIQRCVGAKHSSLSRDLEWQRLRLRDRVRPDFKVLTGNDLAIDMVMYGSD